jgi:hypothetical protein
MSMIRITVVAAQTRATRPKWDNKRKTYVRNDDWLLWNIQPNGTVEEPHKAKR